MSERRTKIAAVLLFAGVVVVYAFLVSAGTFTRWPTYSNYCDLLAEGFRSGRLGLRIAPSPRLLASPDPFDPAMAPYWVWDASLHEGRYFLYWGPLPASLLALVKAAFGISRSLGDQYVVFPFALLVVVFGALLVLCVARRLFPDAPRALVVLAIAVLAFANPIPHSLASPAIYQAAILAGQACLLGGLVLAFDAVDATSPGTRAARKLAGCGVLWALALACRVSLAPAVLLLGLATAWAAVERGPGRARRALPGFLLLGAPIALVSAALLAYNRARFGAWLDFGVGEQLTTMPFHASAAYVPLNLYSYALRPLRIGCEFPYALQPAGFGPAGFPSWLRVPPDYLTQEPVAGILWTLPWCLLAPLGWLAFPLSVRSDPRARVATWCAASFAILGSVTGLPTLVSFIATMRYLGDVAPGIVLSGVLGALWLHSRTAPASGKRRLVLAACAILAVASIVLGLLLGYQGYEGHFRRYNPALHARISSVLSLCGGAPAR